MLRDVSGLSGAQLPAGGHTVGSAELTAPERLVDEAVNPVGLVGLCDKQRSDAHRVALAIRPRMMWGQWAGWLVLPVSAQGHGDRCSGSARVPLRDHGQVGVVGECLPHVVSVSPLSRVVTRLT